MKGTIVGSYRILGTISVGGMGTVYRAEHTLIGRLAAIKILHPELCGNRGIVNRFFNEAKTTSSIKHPGIVEVFDFGYMPSGHAYLIMEFLEGTPLSRRIRARGKMAEGEAATLLRGVCIALSVAHDKGIVHRDLKPDNIMVMPDGDAPAGERIKLLDFGIAKFTDIGLNGSATRTGSVMGTPTYMSPEQCRGTGDVDCRADLYSIGCIYYEMVAGRPPFVRTGAGEAIGSHLFVEPEPPSRHVAGLSADSEALIMKLLAKQPELRVQSARELAHLLTAIAQQHGWLPARDVSRPSLSAAAARPPASIDIAIATMMPSTQLPTDVRLATDAPTTTPRPTSTLSGAASEITGPPKRSRSALRLAIAGALAMATGGIGAALTFSGPSRDAPTPAATAPTPVLRPPAAPEPAPAPARVPAPAATAPPPTTRADKSAQQTIIPAVAPRTAAPSNAAAHAPAVTPAAKPLKKPARKGEKADKAAGSASDDKDLLEQDI